MNNKKSLRIIFMGTPDFAVPALSAIYNSKHNLIATYCQPPKPAGRGHKVKKTPVHIASEEFKIEVKTPKSLKNIEAQNELKKLNPDIIIVAAYGLILPQEILDVPKFGCVNIHGSLLPRWRGAAPIHRALLANDKKTGITIMQMDAGLDTGDIIAKEEIEITNKTTAQSLHDEMAMLGAKMIIPSIENLIYGKIKPTPQPNEGVTYAKKLTRYEGEIKWSESAINLELKVRALNPWPSTFFIFNDEKIKIHKATIIKDKSGIEGTLLNDDFTVACKKDSIRLDIIQRSGKKPTDGSSALRGMRIEIGTKIR